jgi:hypothetical protein
VTDVQASQEVASSDVERFLTSVNSQVIEDPEQISAQIVGDILRARSVEDVLGQRQLVEAESVLGQRIVVRNVRWMGSAFDDGPGFYAVIDAANDDGEPMMIGCGGRNVMAQLFRLIELGALPLYVRIQRADKATAAGYYPLYLDPATAP